MVVARAVGRLHLSTDSFEAVLLQDDVEDACGAVGVKPCAGIGDEFDAVDRTSWQGFQKGFRAPPDKLEGAHRRGFGPLPTHEA